MSVPPNADDPLTPDLSLRIACKLFSKPTRRAIIRYFIATETTTAELTELTAYIQETVETVTSPYQARIMLAHVDLPKLAEHEVVDYDERSGTIRYRGGKQLEYVIASVDLYESFS